MNTSVNLNFNLDMIVVEVDPAVPQASLPSEGAEDYMREAVADVAATTTVLDAASVTMTADSLSGGSPTIKPGMSYNQMLPQPPPYPGSRGRGFTPGKVCENMYYLIAMTVLFNVSSYYFVLFVLLYVRLKRGRSRVRRGPTLTRRPSLCRTASCV